MMEGLPIDGVWRAVEHPFQPSWIIMRRRWGMESKTIIQEADQVGEGRHRTPRAFRTEFEAQLRADVLNRDKA